MTDTTHDTTGLACLLHTRLTAWDQAREPQKLKMLECYQDVMRIPRDGDTSGTGTAKAKKAGSLFIGSTRNKVRAARAKINDALFGAGKFPFDTSPTNEKLAPFADAVETILSEQFERMQLKTLLKTGVNTLATYGTGCIFGPFVREETLTDTTVEGYALKEDKYTFDFPYFELGNTLDVIPDPESRSIGGGLGVFWATMESKHTVAAWGADKRYRNITLALQVPGDNGNEAGSDQASQMRANTASWHKGDRIKVARFFGKVPKSALSGPATGDSATTETELVDAVVIMAGGVVVKVDASPYGGKSPAMPCVYEAVEHEAWGVGVAENNAPHQKVTNAAFRLVMEGKGMALLGTASVDRSKFLPTENFKKHPGKVYQFKPGLTPEERQTAIFHHVEPDITDGWKDLIAMSEQFSDDDTGITKYTQGDDSSGLNKTAAGISMIMSASSLPIKEVIQNIDASWIEEIVERTLAWDLKYLDVETVRRIHGDEIAATWEQIKQFGKTSFMDWQATGTASFMAKEVLINKIRGFAEFALSNPATAAKVDPTELLNQFWNAMEIGKESPVLEPEGEVEIPPQVQEQMTMLQQQIEQMGQALNQAHEEVKALESGAALKEKEIGLKEREIAIKDYDAKTKRIGAVRAPGAGGTMPLEPELDAEGTPMTQEQSAIAAMLDMMGQMQQMMAVIAAPKRIVRDEAGRAIGTEAVLPEPEYAPEMAEPMQPDPAPLGDDQPTLEG